MRGAAHEIGCGIEPDGDARSGSTSATGTLNGRGLADILDGETREADRYKQRSFNSLPMPDVLKWYWDNIDTPLRQYGIGIVLMADRYWIGILSRCTV